MWWLVVYVGDFIVDPHQITNIENRYRMTKLPKTGWILKIMTKILMKVMVKLQFWDVGAKPILSINQI